MTLADLFKLIRHYAKLVVAIPLISAVIAAGAIFLLPPTYEAEGYAFDKWGHSSL